MRFAYVGNFTAPWCTEVHVAASLQELGHDVVELQESTVRLPEIERVANDCDALLYTRTWGMLASTGRPCLPPAPTGEALAMLDRLRVPSASWHLDLYHGLPRGSAAMLKADPFWRTRHVFSPDGSPAAAAFFAANGVRHHYLKPGVLRAECYLAAPVEELAADVVFVGSEGYHAEWPYRGKLIRWLRDTYGARFVKHGHPQSLVRGHRLNQLYASAKVVVGDTLCLGFNHPNYWSDRVYETLGRGGFLIHPRIAGMEEEFADGEHLAFYNFNDWSGLRERIDHFLAHDDERERVRLAGHELVRSRCTYTDRARQVVATLEAA